MGATNRAHASGKDERRAVLVEPVHFALRAREDAAQDQCAHALGMCLRIGERQRRAPRAAEHEPVLDAEALAQRLDVGDKVLRRVGLQFGVRARAAAAALVEQDDHVMVGIEQAAVIGMAAAARPAVQEQRGLALRVARRFPADAVIVADIEMAADANGWRGG